MRPFSAAMLFFWLGACTPAPGPEALNVELSSTVTSVELGLPFRVEVVRTFPRSFEPAPFDPSSLAPLEARLVRETRRSRRGRVTETLELEARAFALDTLTVPAPVLRARPTDGGAERSVRGEPLRITVHSALAAAPGAAAREAELPGGLLPEHAPPRPFPFAALVGALGIAALLTTALVGFARRASRRRDTRVPPESPPNSRERALRRLRALEERAEDPALDDDAFHVELAALVRAFLAEAQGVPAPRRSTEEVLADVRVDAASRETLRTTFEACDTVKFAARRAHPAERAALTRDVEAWLAHAPARSSAKRSSANPRGGAR